MYQTVNKISNMQTINWTASSEFGTYHLCEQRRFRRACASAQSRQNLRCWLIQAVSQEEPSDRKPDPWPLWMAGHAQLKFVMTECLKTQIRLTGLNFQSPIGFYHFLSKFAVSSKTTSPHRTTQHEISTAHNFVHLSEQFFFNVLCILVQIR